MDGSTFLYWYTVLSSRNTEKQQQNNMRKHLLFPFFPIIAGTVLTAVGLFTGCQKEQTVNRLKIVTEGMGDNSKMTVDGLASYWESGDKVNVNGMEATVTLDNGNAYINDIPAADNYCIVFPSSIYSEHTGSVVTVDMPSTYYYRSRRNSNTGTYTQILDAPLAYCGTADDGTAIMRHLTGALNVQITRPSGMRIQRITVSTSQNRVMSGEMQFDLSNIDAASSTATNATSNNYVEMLFDYYNLESTNTYLFSLYNQSVQIPIPVLSGNVNFIITVEGILGGTKYTFQRTQTTGGHLGRGEMANVAVNMNDGQPGVTKSALFETTVLDGTTYYMIQNAYDFRLMAYAVTGIQEGSAADEDWSWDPIYYYGADYANANYLVTADFDMKGKVTTTVRGLRGEFNGGGHTISNVVAGGDYWESGLFVSYSPIAVKNITFNGLRVAANYASEYSMPISALGRAGLISNVHILDYEVTGTRYVPQVGGFTSSATTVQNSSIAFKSGQVIQSTSYVRYTPPTILGGICAVCTGGSPTWENVTVDFGNIEFSKTYSGYLYSTVFGGLFGTTARYNNAPSTTISTDNISNVTIRGTVTVNNYGNGDVYKANVFVNGNTIVNEMDGVDASGLTIN